MSEIKSIIDYLHGLGLRTVEPEYRSHIDLWRSWYRGKVDQFHFYTVYNGIRTSKVERATLGMAKTVSEDWANLLLNERVAIAASAGQDTLDRLLADNRFPVEGNRSVERAFALGTAAFSEYLDGSGKPCVDYHKGSEIWPLEWQGTRITECAFASVLTRGDDKLVFLRCYRLDPDGSQRIENRCLDAESGKAAPLPDGVPAVVHTGLKLPLFQILTPNLANNIDTSCPMGISVYANAIDVLQGVDAVYDSFRNEFILGRKRLMVPLSMVQVARSQEAGAQPVFDPNDMVYTAFQPAEGQNAGFFDLSPDIRAQQHLEGLRTQLDLLSLKCGLGVGRYEFDRASGVKTATEVISEQSDLYQSMVKHEQVLRDALTGLARSLLALSGVQTAEVSVTFDDSVIQDKATLRAEARDAVAAGLMSRYRYLTEILGMSEADAEAELARIRSEGSVAAEAVDFFGVNGAE